VFAIPRGSSTTDFQIGLSVPLIFPDLLVLNVFSVQTRLAQELPCLNLSTDCQIAVDAGERLFSVDSNEEYMCD
jgi:hypothetical protein